MAAYTVGTSDVKVLDKNQSRLRVTIVNDSTNIVYLMKGRTAVSGDGIRLNANGGSYEDQKDMFGYIFTQEYHAVATGAGSNVTVIEE